MSQRERILQREKAKPVPFYVEAWEETVYIRRLSLDDQEALGDIARQPAKMVAAVLISSLEDDSGTPLFLPEDEDAIRKMPFADLLPVFTEAAKLNGLSNKELDEAMASFENARTGSGPSSSPSPSTAPATSSERSLRLS